jgi:hypothetical protein
MRRWDLIVLHSVDDAGVIVAQICVQSSRSRAYTSCKDSAPSGGIRASTRWSGAMG